MDEALPAIAAQAWLGAKLTDAFLPASKTQTEPGAKLKGHIYGRGLS